MDSIQTILVGTDFQECGDRAVSAALDLGERVGAQLHFAHVVEHMSSNATPSGEPLVVRYIEQARRRAKEKLEEIEARAADRGLETSFHIPEGDPRWALVNLAEKIDADCVLVGSHGRRGLAHLWFGSVAECVVREAPCSVLVVRGEAKPFACERIVLGDDLTPHSTDARALACELARELGCELTVVHSLDLGLPYLSTLDVVVPNGLFESLGERARDRLEELAQESPALTTENVVVDDGPARELIRRAERPGVGLIVVGRDSTGRVDRLLLGAVAERVVRQSAASVLVARRRKE